MAIKLVEIGERPDFRREILVEKDAFLIGRGTDCDLQLNDTVISRHHCVLTQRSGKITLADLGSSNGTYVNSQRLVSQTNVKSGDEIRIGAFRFYIDLGDSMGVAWGADEIDPGQVTSKIKDVRKEMEAAREKYKKDLAGDEVNNSEEQTKHDETLDS